MAMEKDGELRGFVVRMAWIASVGVGLQPGVGGGGLWLQEMGV